METLVNLVEERSFVLSLAGVMLAVFIVVARELTRAFRVEKMKTQALAGVLEDAMASVSEAVDESLTKGGERGSSQSPPKAGPEANPLDVVSGNFRLLEKYYDQTLGEYKINSRATVTIASLGFVVIIVGAGFAMAGYTTVGVVSSIAGLIAEAATVLFFKQNQLQIEQVREYHRKLVSTQYLLTAVSLAGTLSTEVRERESQRVITNLLYLSNELHGSPSPHLVPPTELSKVAAAQEASSM